jgi:murein DD-endopeptidase MepM/ murein hydrolase activator NlpD
MTDAAAMRSDAVAAVVAPAVAAVALGLAVGAVPALGAASAGAASGAGAASAGAVPALGAVSARAASATAAVSAGAASVPAAVSASAASGGAVALASGPGPSGGARFGAAVPRPAVQPVVRWLAVSPRTVVAGSALPRLRFRLRQRGMAQVQARVVVLRLPRRAPVARVSLGWVKIGRRVSVRWPAGVRLRKGRYLLRLHVKDSRGHTLRRDARHPGRTRIVVRAPRIVVPPVVVPAPSASLPAPAASPGGRGVFPVAGAFGFGGVDARFGAGRIGHIHEGQDILAASGTPVVAPYGGTVSSTSYQADGAGEYVVLDAIDGRDYFFAHCIRGSTAVAEGAAVAAGAPLCRVGATGTASAPHLHFEIWNVGWRIDGGYPIDPLPELRGWAPG